MAQVSASGNGAVGRRSRRTNSDSRAQRLTATARTAFQESGVAPPCRVLHGVPRRDTEGSQPVFATARGVQDGLGEDLAAIEHWLDELAKMITGTLVIAVSTALGCALLL